MTHAANRLRRRKALRALPFTDDDRKRFGRLVAVAAASARYPEGDPKPLAKARRHVRGRTLPPGQATPGSCFDQLCRLADRWAAMLATDRIAHGPALAALAEACRIVLDAVGGDGPRSRPHADVDG